VASMALAAHLVNSALRISIMIRRLGIPVDRDQPFRFAVTGWWRPILPCQVAAGESTAHQRRGIGGDGSAHAETRNLRHALGWLGPNGRNCATTQRHPHQTQARQQHGVGLRLWHGRTIRSPRCWS
jgi:hypothetical protein